MRRKEETIMRQPRNKQDDLVNRFTKNQCKAELRVITESTKTEIEKITKDKTLDKIRQILREKIHTTIKLQVSKNPNADPEVLEVLEELARFITRSPILPNDGMAFRHIEYDDIGHTAIIKLILSVAKDEEFKSNITPIISLKEEKTNILAKAALRQNPTIIVINHKERTNQSLRKNGITINIENATPYNFKTFDKSQKNGYAEVLCIPLIGDVFNSGLLTIFSKTPFKLNSNDTIEEIKEILRESNLRTQQLQEHNLYKILNDINTIAENEAEAFEAISKILIGNEGDLRCSIAKIWKENGEKTEMTKKTAGYPPNKHGKDEGWKLAKRPLLEHVFKTEEPIVVNNPRFDNLTKYLSQPGGIIDQHNVNSIFALPIKDINNHVTEVIVFDSNKKNAFSKEKQEHLIKLVALLEKMIIMGREMREYRLSSIEKHDLKELNMTISGFIQMIEKKQKQGISIDNNIYTHLFEANQRKSEIENTGKNMELIKQGEPIVTYEYQIEKIEKDLRQVIHKLDCKINNLVSNTQLKISTDRAMLKRVFRNLLKNTQIHGIKNQEGFVPIECTIKLDDSQDFLLYEFQNPGNLPDLDIFQYGITTQHKKENQNNSNPFDRNGQGLSIAKSILTAMNATIQAYSENGKVTFTVKIPLNKEISE